MNFLDDLKAFVGAGFEMRELTYKGKTRKFYFRELSADEAEKLLLDFASGSEKEKEKKARGLRNRVLESILCDDKGAPVVTAAQAGEWPNQFANMLQTAAFEVNGFNDKAKDDAGKD